MMPDPPTDPAAQSDRPPAAALAVTPAAIPPNQAKDRPAFRLMLAHGAGAGMDSPFLENLSHLVAGRGIGVIRFEFTYMAARRTGGKRRPPPKAAWRRRWPCR